MKNKMLTLSGLILACFLVGCQQNSDELPSSIATPELAQNSDKEAFLSKINDLVSSGDVQNQIAEPLGDVHFEDLVYFKSDFEENVTFIPLYTESSDLTEAIIIGTEREGRYKLGILTRGTLWKYGDSAAERVASVSTLAWIFKVYDQRIFENENTRLQEIIGNNKSSAAAKSQAIGVESTELNIKSRWRYTIFCYGGTEEDDELIDCWVSEVYWEESPSDPILIDQGSSGGGNESYIPWVTDPNKPCAKSPVKNPEIAPQPEEKSGINGGRYGPTRKYDDGSAKNHNGLDIKNNLGDGVYSMYGGSIFANGTSATLGNYSIIESNINGKIVMILYAHLKHKPSTSGSITQGQLLGIAGDSGNLKLAKSQGAVQHLHIEVREGPDWAAGSKVNAENYLGVKFDDNGNAIAGTGTC